MRYDCRNEGRDPLARSFPCPVKILCAVTGERIANVFFLDTSPARVGRFVTGPDGQPLARYTGRKLHGLPVHLVDVQGAPTTRQDGKQVQGAVREYERMELFESRPWVAVAVDTGEVIAKSEENGE